jgi:hypothetical protein
LQHRDLVLIVLSDAADKAADAFITGDDEAHRVQMERIDRLVRKIADITRERNDIARKLGVPID